MNSSLPDAVRTLIAPWWRGHAQEIADALDAALTAGEERVVVGGASVTLDAAADAAGWALEMAEALEAP